MRLYFFHSTQNYLLCCVVNLVRDSARNAHDIHPLLFRYRCHMVEFNDILANRHDGVSEISQTPPLLLPSSFDWVSAAPKPSRNGGEDKLTI